jgi:hypothetical protein
VLLLAVLFIYPNAEMTQSLEWWPKDLPEPVWWKEVRVWALFALALLLPLSTVGDRRAKGRVLCWGMVLITLFFCVRSTGDWMKGYRWMSFLAVPASVLFAAGVYELAWFAQRWFGRVPDRVWSRPGWMVAVVLVLAVLPGFYIHSEWFFKKRETGPFSVQERVEYTASLIERMYVEGKIYNLDVDMGAHMYWSTHSMLDMAGLIDVTIAHHDYGQRAVTKEYVFQERRPQIAHVHGGWASTSRIPTFPEWKKEYMQVPGFPAGKTTLHVGNHVRRDLVMPREWSVGPERRASFGDGITLVGFKVPSAEISLGKSLFLEVGVEYRKQNGGQDFRVVGFLSNETGAVSAFDVPMAYDWLPPVEWQTDELFVGRFAPSVSRDLPPGMYDLGFVVFGADGVVIPPVEGPAPEGSQAVFGGRDGVPARFAVGEVRFANVVSIGEPGTGERAAKADLDRALLAAAEGRCTDAEDAWRLAWQHVPKATAWSDEHRPGFARAVSSCWAAGADAEGSLRAAAGQIEAARTWDHRNPAVWQVGERVGEALYNEGLAQREAGEWQSAYEAFSGAVTANPSLSWARRYAEEARDHRLGLDPDSLATQEAQREARLQGLRERDQERREQAEAAEGGDGEAEVEQAPARGPRKTRNGGPGALNPVEAEPAAAEPERAQPAEAAPEGEEP